MLHVINSIPWAHLVPVASFVIGGIAAWVKGRK